MKARGWWQRSAAAVTGSGAARATTGGVAVSGVVHGDVAVHAPSSARSGYRQQVLRIAPPELVARETELAQLAAFCTAPDRGPYEWWQAGPWAGKTALMAWFALHPPESVEIVPFFVTARFAGQSDRTAFTEVVAEQLTALLGQPMPSYVTEATREGHLLDALEETARLCQGRGRRLVLLVDGLDEDRGVTTGPDAYSIAALLPARPPAGLRVIVAGRPDPPVPADVPEDHPLRAPGIVRRLGLSGYASVVRADCERELTRLVRGTTEERDLLGLVAAAGGGLSRTDLAELTGCGPWEVAQHLKAVTGRTFAARAGGSGSAGPESDAPEVYVLGHEELQTTALTMLGRDKLSAYRARLHAWAATYRDRGWPPASPEYLLRGYPRLLRATADLPRAVACATDPARHDRIREATGGDAAVLAEIDAARDLVLASENPDLVWAALLCAHRQRLVDRSYFPMRLPAVWAAVGQADRAEALARGMDEPNTVAAALAEVALVVGARGDRARAADLADGIEGLDSGDGDTVWRARRLAAEAEAAGAAGDHDRAASLDRAMGAVLAHAARDSDRVHVLASRARAAAASGARGRAGELADAIENLARTGTGFSWQRDVVWAADSLEPERVAAALRHLAVLARTVRSPLRRASIEAKLAAAAAAGVGRQGPALLEAAAELMRWARPDLGTLEVIGPLTEAVVASGDAPRAARLADLIAETAAVPDHPGWADAVSSRALARAAVEALTACADRERAAALSRALEAVARWSGESGAAVPGRDQGDRGNEAPLMVGAVGAAALAGDDARAEGLARTITEPYERAEALIMLARVMLDRGEGDRAAELARAAERFCREAHDPGPRARALAALARTSAAQGDHKSAARLTDALAGLAGCRTSPVRRAEVQVSWARALAVTGAPGRVEETVWNITVSEFRKLAQVELVGALSDRDEFDRAEAFLLGIGSDRERDQIGLTLAHCAITRGALDRAGRLLDTHPSAPDDRARLVTALTRAAAVGGARHRAGELAVGLVALARSHECSRLRSAMERYTAEALAWSRCYDTAAQLARGVTDPLWRAEAMAALITAAARSGEPGLARVWAHRAAKELSRPTTDRWNASHALERLVEVVTAIGDLGTAVDLAEHITHFSHRARAQARLTRFVEPAQGRRMMAHALARGDWRQLLDDLVRLAPQALPALITMHLGRERAANTPESGPGSTTLGTSRYDEEAER